MTIYSMIRIDSQCDVKSCDFANGAFAPEKTAILRFYDFINKKNLEICSFLVKGNFQFYTDKLKLVPVVTPIVNC